MPTEVQTISINTANRGLPLPIMPIPGIVIELITPEPSLFEIDVCAILARFLPMVGSLAIGRDPCS